MYPKEVHPTVTLYHCHGRMYLLGLIYHDNFLPPNREIFARQRLFIPEERPGTDFRDGILPSGERSHSANRISYKMATMVAKAASNQALVTDLKSVGRKTVPVRVRPGARWERMNAEFG